MAVGDDGRVIVEEAEYLSGQGYDDDYNDESTTHVQEQGAPGYFLAAGKLPCSIVLSDEGGTGLAEGVDDEVGENLHVKGRRGSRHDVRAKRVDR